MLRYAISYHIVILYVMLLYYIVFSHDVIHYIVLYYKVLLATEEALKFLGRTLKGGVSQEYNMI